MDRQEEPLPALPLEQRLTEKLWKYRQSAYIEYSTLFENSRNQHDECFNNFSPAVLVNIVTDLNVIAQEAGINLLLKYLEFANPEASVVDQLRSQGLVKSLCEKGLSSSRSGTKSKSLETILTLVQFASDPNVIVQDIVSFHKHKLPKLVAACVNALYQIIDSFGCEIVSPAPIIDILPKLFAHGDRNVRLETTKLTVELYKWLKDGLKKTLFDDLKPVQQKDLTKAFELIEDEIPQQKRLTRAQKELQLQEQNDPSSPNEMETDTDASVAAAPVDPFDLMAPVEILPKIPAEFPDKVRDSSWKIRKEGLDEVHEILSKVSKLSSSEDFSDLVRIFAKCMSDANIMVVQLAANCVEFLALGLRKQFHTYTSYVLFPILERTKEKKQSVVEALNNALTAIFKSSGLSEILLPTLEAMRHKTPLVKISATNYLTQCLSQTEIPPSSNEIDTIMGVAVKLLTEPQEPIRQASTNSIGTLMKITGERELKGLLEKVDDNRKSKIYKVFESAEVKCKSDGADASSRPVNTPKPTAPRTTGTLKPPPKKVVAPSSTLPSKRLATSPAKRQDPVPKFSSFSRGLTGRPLASNGAIPKLSQPDQMEVDTVDYQELQQLRDEKKARDQQDNDRMETLERIMQENSDLKQANQQLNLRLEQSEQINQSAQNKLRQKDHEISRLTNEVESMKLKVQDLENTIQTMKLPHKPLPPQFSPNEPFEAPQRITSGELSSRVNRLSIDAETKENNPAFSRPFSFEDRDKDWSSAADITNQLKARIQKMKARTSIAHNNI